MKKETLASIAKQAGCSTTTVSRVLSGNAERYRISKATCETVTKIAQRLNYYSRSTAQDLRYAQSHMIGLILPSIANPYFAEMASVIIEDLRQCGYSTVTFDAMEDEKAFREGLNSLISKQVKGIICAPCGDNRIELENHNAICPIITIDRYYSESSLPYVSTDNFKGGCEGTKQLLSRGYRKIACIQGVKDSVPNKERARGYVETMKQAGLEENITIVGDDFSIKNGYLETKLLLGRENRPDAIFTFSGTILLGALKAIHETDLKIPEDIALLSYDDSPYMDFLTPPLARIKQPEKDMASLAVKILLDKIAGENSLNSQILLSPTFVSGQSI